jgi:hypothetical protein
VGIVSGLLNRARVITDPRYRHFYRHRLVGDMPTRTRMADDLAAKLPTFSSSPSPFAEGLLSDGNVMIEPLDARRIQAMRDFFSTERAHDPYRRKLGTFLAPAEAPKETHVAFFENEQVVRAPHALELANEPAVLSAIAAVLGARPTISYITAWWSIPHGTRAEHAELFHRDVDDLRFVKMFVYLTDVDEDSGPHMFVKGSQRVNKLTEAGRRIPEAEVEDAFGKENLLRFTGPAGTRFLENTYGVHRGIPPARKPRLLFQVLYTLVPYVGGPKRPIAPLPAGYDPYINRVYCR